MGDEDVKYNMSNQQFGAMGNLLKMHEMINKDGSGYYKAPKTLDESLREKHPSLQDAWEKYQEILTICKQDHYAKTL